MQRTLTWYAYRLSRMPPSEWAHRLREWRRHAGDRQWQHGWQGFGAPARIKGIPRLSVPADQPLLRERANEIAAALLRGQLRFLGQDWPALGRSWWQNPEVWFRDPVTGAAWPSETYGPDIAYRHAAPLGDVKFIWELNRLQLLPALVLAGEPQVAFDILFAWMEANPPWRGVNWTVGLEAAIRLVSLFAALALAGEGSWSNDLRLAAFVDAHVRRIARYPSLYSSANNHRMAELAGLVLGGCCAPAIAPGLVRPAWQEIEKQIVLQFHSDGSGAEQSPAYAAYSLEWALLAAIVAEQSGAAPSVGFRHRLSAACDALLWLSDAKGSLPQIGDDDEARVLSFDAEERHYSLSVVAAACRWLNRPQPSPDLREPSLRDALVPDGTQHPTWRPGDLTGCRTFVEGGYTIWRQPSPHGLRALFFDHGPLGFLSIAAHGHADALSIWLHWGEESIMVDAGTYLYHAGTAVRDKFRGTLAHNTLAVSGADQSLIAGPFNWRAHAQTALLCAEPSRVEAVHDGYLKRFGVTHRRRVTLSADEFMVEDFLDGRPQKPRVDWSLGFTLAPGIRPRILGRQAWLETPAGRRMHCTAHADWGLREVPQSPSFNITTSAYRLTLAGELLSNPVSKVTFKFL